MFRFLRQSMKYSKEDPVQCEGYIVISIWDLSFTKKVYKMEAEMAKIIQVNYKNMCT